MILPRQPVLRRCAGDIGVFACAYPATVVVAVMTASAGVSPLSCALAACMLELGTVAILVPWACSNGGAWREEPPRIVARSAFLLIISCGLALVLAGKQVEAALLPVLKWQLVASTFAIVLAGTWQVIAGATGRKPAAQVASTLTGGLMLSSLFWSPVILDVLSPGAGKNALMSVLVWSNPLLNATAWALGVDLSMMPHGYKYGVFASYGFLYPAGWLIVIVYGTAGAALCAAGTLLRRARKGRGTEANVQKHRGSPEQVKRA